MAMLTFAGSELESAPVAAAVAAVDATVCQMGGIGTLMMLYNWTIKQNSQSVFLNRDHFTVPYRIIICPTAWEELVSSFFLLVEMHTVEEQLRRVLVPSNYVLSTVT